MILNIEKVYAEFLPRTCSARDNRSGSEQLRRAQALTLWINYYPGYVRACTSADLDEQDLQMLAEARTEAKRLTAEASKLMGCLFPYTDKQADRQLYATREWSC